MTVESLTKSITYAGDGGVTTTFPYPFKVYSADHLVVTITAGGVDTVLTTSDYTVTGVGLDGGGNVKIPSGVASGATLTIERHLDLKQRASVTNQSSVFAETHEKVWDLLAMADMQQQEEIDALVNFHTKAGDPTTSEVPAGQCQVWKNSSTGALKLWANDGGSLKSVTLS